MKCSEEETNRIGFLSHRTEDRVDAATDDCDRSWTRRLGVFASVLTPKAVLI